MCARDGTTARSKLKPLQTTRKSPTRAWEGNAGKGLLFLLLVTAGQGNELLLLLLPLAAGHCSSGRGEAINWRLRGRTVEYRIQRASGRGRKAAQRMEEGEEERVRGRDFGGAACVAAGAEQQQAAALGSERGGRASLVLPRWCRTSMDTPHCDITVPRLRIHSVGRDGGYHDFRRKDAAGGNAISYTQNCFLDEEKKPDSPKKCCAPLIFLSKYLHGSLESCMSVTVGMLVPSFVPAVPGKRGLRDIGNGDALAVRSQGRRADREAGAPDLVPEALRSVRH